MNVGKKMNRRDALKCLGAAVLSSTLATSGVMSLASCHPKAKRRVVLYFTGTGNSLYIARQLAGEDGETLSIPQLIKNKQFDIEADEIGLVYPIYGHMPPRMVWDYIEQAKLAANYKFAVLTYGNRTCSAVEIWDAISRKAGHVFDYIGTIVMVDNWLPNFDMNEQMKIDKHIPENLARLAKDIRSHRHFHEPVSEEQRQQHQEFLQCSGIDPAKGFTMMSEESFVVADSCIECGICTYVCPRGNYKLTSTGATMSGACDFCFACIQNCPQKAIRFAEKPEGGFPSAEKNPNARYRNEHVSLMDLKMANNQF